MISRRLLSKLPGVVILVMGCKSEHIFSALFNFETVKRLSLLILIAINFFVANSALCHSCSRSCNSYIASQRFVDQGLTLGFDLFDFIYYFSGWSSLFSEANVKAYVAYYSTDEL